MRGAGSMVSAIGAIVANAQWGRSVNLATAELLDIPHCDFIAVAAAGGYTNPASTGLDGM